MARTNIGAPVKRKEDIRFLTGRATFIDDLKLDGMLHAAVLRSPHGHALIKSIDTSRARRVPGVIALFTFLDIASIAKPIPLRMYPLLGLDRFLQYPLARDRVRYVGEPVALAIAESRYVAEDALELVDVSYEPLPAVVDMKEALRNEVLLYEEAGTNLAAQFTVSKGDVEKAFRTADYTRKESLKVHRHTGNPLETRGLIATYSQESGELTVLGPTKVPHFNRGVLAKLLDFPEEKIHFSEPDVGGGFGIRGEFYPEDLLIPWAAIRLGVPIKWIEDRREHLMAANHSREVLYEMEIAARSDGTILGIRGNVYGNMGAYIRTHGALLPTLGARFLTGPYHIPNFEYRVHCVLTNKTGAGTYRAPGRYESCFTRERLLDMVAADLNMDPVELRLKNFIRPSEMPYEVGVTFPGNSPDVIDSGNYASALQKGLDAAKYDKLKHLNGTLRKGKYHGVGIACYIKDTGRGPYEGARIAVDKAGRVSIYLGITTMGQGHETSMAQVCADGLGVPVERIDVYHGSTDLTSFGVGTFASRGGVMAGNAVYLAAQKLRRKILTIASDHLGVPETDLDYYNGRLYRKGTRRRPLLSIGDVVELGKDARYREDEPSESQTTGKYLSSGSAFNSTSILSVSDVLKQDRLARPGEDEEQLDVTAFFESEHYVFPYGTHVAHVAVDPETGKIDILDYVIVEDIGRAINPIICHGQAVGSCVQGIGGTILEELVYDENGQLLTTTFMDYLLPLSTDVPAIKSIILEEAPSPYNPLGVKGAGEGGIVGTGAALANAVSNALKPLGVNVTELPLSPNRIRELVRRGANPR